MKTKSRYKIKQIDNHNTTVYKGIWTAVQVVYPYDYPDLDYFKRKEKREQRKNKIVDLFPEFKNDMATNI